MGNEENMAFNQNIAQEYNRNKILTASPAELTLMLYEGAILQYSHDSYRKGRFTESSY